MKNLVQFLALQLCLVLLLQPQNTAITALNVVIPGGTGKLGAKVASSLSSKNHDVTILCRNAFLAAAPNRVSGDFGWVGQSYLEHNPNVRLRDWDGGDLTDIVGCDWMGWQEDALKSADVVINLVGGYTEQRVMATERIVRESLAYNPNALQIAVRPTEEDIRQYSKGALAAKLKRLELCEQMVKQNCKNGVCLELEMFDEENSCNKILEAVEKN